MITITRLIAMVFLLPLILAPWYAGAEDAGFTLDVLAPTAKEIAFTVPASGSVPLRIMQKGVPSPGLKVDLALSEFVGEKGSSVPVELTVDGTDLPAAREQKGVPFPGVLLPIHLKVPPFPTPGKYSGTLVVVNPQKGSREAWLIGLTSAQESRPAMLVLDQGAATLTGVKGVLFGRGEGPSLTVHVRDKSGFWALDGVIGRLEPGLVAPGGAFDMKRNLAATFNNQAADLGTSPPAGQRSVPPGQQATLGLHFVNLEVGSYTVPLRFLAANSGVDDQQRLTVSIQMRHWWPWAVLTLLLATLTSFVGTQLATGMRRRAAFLDRGRTMRPSWLTQERAVLPVIWFQAKLRQIEELSKRYWLTGQTGIDLKLTQAAGMLQILDRIHHLRERIAQRLEEEPIRKRATWLMDNIVSSIDADPSEQETTRIKAELDALEQWLDPAKTDACYWNALLPVIRRLLAEVEIGACPPEGEAEIKRLMAELEKVKDKGLQPTHDEMLTFEKRYERLRILWNHREDALLPQLLSVPADAVNRLFHVVDNADWDRLKARIERHEVVAEAPSPDFLNPIEAYMPVTFRLNAPDDPGLMGTFLAQKQLVYTWKFEIRNRDRLRREKVAQLEVTSVEPKVTQYAPGPGKITLREVLIQYPAGQEKTVLTRQEQKDTEKAQGRWDVPIGRSSDFTIWCIAERADFIALFIAAIAGIASGLMLYIQNPTFGSAKDYLQLFMWGAGIDQTKNFIQALGSKPT